MKFQTPFVDSNFEMPIGMFWSVMSIYCQRKDNLKTHKLCWKGFCVVVVVFVFCCCLIVVILSTKQQGKYEKQNIGRRFGASKMQ